MSRQSTRAEAPLARFVGRSLIVLALVASPTLAWNDTPDVKFDRAQADAALSILGKRAAGETVGEADWRALFATSGYRRLKDREAAMGRAFTDAEFKSFLEMPRTPQQIEALRRTLQDWSSQPIAASARAALAYLPVGARLKATVFPMVKPKPNSFVFDLAKDPAIFLYLDPEVPGAKARNTLSHELHHIGMGSSCPAPKSKTSGPAAKLSTWMSAYGEGLAMLAAAGNPDTHPHSVSSAKERAEWDANIARVDALMAEQNAFFLSVLDGKAGDDAAIDKKMMGYFGVQGPWYTVGWKMATTIEVQFGRERAIDAFCDPRQLLATYNEAARMQNRSRTASLPLWDQRLAATLAGQGSPASGL
ncbi:MAG TPA: DUF5700 domain-containing putative Zn-dependent protease [Luteimonas sp.]|nr:DUF5700 domain-containing putative Zn-dependent protease [Luteimonas sp.]